MGISSMWAGESRALRNAIGVKKQRKMARGTLNVPRATPDYNTPTFE